MSRRLVDVLALVPNLLSGRIDQQTQDRQLLDPLNSHDNLQSRIPNFARITDWEAVDAGDFSPSPGIRDRTHHEGLRRAQTSAGLRSRL
jgi:chromosome partitioning protein